MTDDEPRYRDILASELKGIERWEILWYLLVFLLGYALSDHGVTIW